MSRAWACITVTNSQIFTRWFDSVKDHIDNKTRRWLPSAFQTKSLHFHVHDLNRTDRPSFCLYSNTPILRKKLRAFSCWSKLYFSISEPFGSIIYCFEIWTLSGVCHYPLDVDGYCVDGFVWSSMYSVVLRCVRSIVDIFVRSVIDVIM